IRIQNSISVGVDVVGCTAYNNSGYGIYIYYNSNNNNIINCDAYNNKDGIYFYRASNCNVINCNVYNNNQYGIYIFYRTSNNNLIHHNNFVNNAKNAYENRCGSNTWDDGSEGNYWSDYAGVDEDGNGIGDTPYLIPGGSNQDRFPLMSPLDNVPPMITYVTATPEVKIPGDPVNITCTVIDIEVVTVKVHIDGPEGFTLEEEMNEGSSYHSYYYEDTYTIFGEYYYYIWANDTSGNIAVSDIYSFVITEFGKPI
ncbi:unnamed protein product, partial [marine sediment metagenome]